MSERKSQPKSQKAKSTAGKRRRQWGAMLTGKRLVAAVSLVLVVLAGTGGWWAWSGGHAQRAVEKMRWRVIAATSQLGFKVDEILVVGRRETRQEDLLKAVRLARGAPILAFDLKAAKARVEKLPWVKAATVERMLPNTILLNVEERQPIAIWQHKGEFALIDHTGEVIMRHGLARFSDLIVVVGKEAPKRASSLLHMLSAAPELIPFVKAAQWVGERRWNLRLKGGIDVRLPEADAAAAWQRLADYERAHRVLERDVQVLDLRIPDRLIVRKTPRPESDKKKGQET
jgi:cell division protein FtsQ